jgi:hypothetical protein
VVFHAREYQIRPAKVKLADSSGSAAASRSNQADDRQPVRLRYTIQHRSSRWRTNPAADRVSEPLALDQAAMERNARVVAE